MEGYYAADYFSDVHFNVDYWYESPSETAAAFIFARLHTFGIAASAARFSQAASDFIKGIIAMSKSITITAENKSITIDANAPRFEFLSEDTSFAFSGD